jgi:hypothetical protein
MQGRMIDRTGRTGSFQNRTMRADKDKYPSRRLKSSTIIQTLVSHSTARAVKAHQKGLITIIGTTVSE